MKILLSPDLFQILCPIPHLRLLFYQQRLKAWLLPEQAHWPTEREHDGTQVKTDTLQSYSGILSPLVPASYVTSPHYYEVEEPMSTRYWEDVLGITGADEKPKDRDALEPSWTSSLDRCQVYTLKFSLKTKVNSLELSSLAFPMAASLPGGLGPPGRGNIGMRNAVA